MSVNKYFSDNNFVKFISTQKRSLWETYSNPRASVSNPTVKVVAESSSSSSSSSKFDASLFEFNTKKVVFTVHGSNKRIF